MITQMSFEHQFILASQYVFNYFAPRIHRSELLIVWAVLNSTLGSERDEAIISFSYFAELTDLSKQAISNGIQAALADGLIGRKPYGNTFTYWFIGDEDKYREVDDSRPRSTPYNRSQPAQNGGARAGRTASNRSTQQTDPASNQSTQQTVYPVDRSTQQTAQNRQSNRQDSYPQSNPQSNPQNTGGLSTKSGDFEELSTSDDDSCGKTVYSADTSEVSLPLRNSSEENLLHFNDLLRVLDSIHREDCENGGQGFYNSYTLARKMQRLGWTGGTASDLWSKCRKGYVGIGYFVNAALLKAPPPEERPDPEEYADHGYGDWGGYDASDSILGKPFRDSDVADKYLPYIRSLPQDVLAADLLERGVITSLSIYSSPDDPNLNLPEDWRDEVDRLAAKDPRPYVVKNGVVVKNKPVVEIMAEERAKKAQELKEKEEAEAKQASQNNEEPAKESHNSDPDES